VTRIELTKEAERDLINIFLFGVEHFGVVQAERYSSLLTAKIESAAANPSFGADYDFVRSGLLRYEATSHAIYYRQTSDGILVLRILHGRMDPVRHLT
jgi:toxin ParE1/3/4